MLFCPYRMPKDLESSPGLTERDAARNTANTGAANGDRQG
jgi:hypothetical protein